LAINATATIRSCQIKISPIKISSAQLGLASSADLRCPNCGSADLKKVSLAYEEGLFCTVARTRLRAVAVDGRGPDLLVARATTRGSHQSVLSKQLRPPVKWSYRKLILWWVVVFLSIGWIVFRINSITKHSAAILSPSLTFSRCCLPPRSYWFVLEASIHKQASVFPVGTLVPLPTLRHFNGAG
jgi:hypothetical protein